MKFLTFTFLILLSFTSHAVQTLEGDSDTVFKVTASLEDPNIISIDGGSIESVWGTDDKVSLEPNVDTGQAIFTPLTNQSFTLFVQSLGGNTYTLNVTPQTKLIGQSILIKEFEQGERSGFERSLNVIAYKKEVKRILKEIEQTPGVKRLKGFRIKVVNKKIPLWAETNILHSISWKRGGMIIHKYLITNVTDEMLTIEEREFKQLSGLVRAVSIKKHQLKPAETTVMYTFGSES